MRRCLAKPIMCVSAPARSTISGFENTDISAELFTFAVRFIKDGDVRLEPDSKVVM